MRRALINARIYDFSRYIPNGFVIFEETIILAGPMEEFPKFDGPVVDVAGQWLLPGFVCGHTHMYSAFARGLLLPFNPKNFQDILDQLWWKLDHALDEEANYNSGLLAASEFIKHGVTTIFDHHASGTQITGSLTTLLQAVTSVGLRCAYAFEVSDRFDVTTAISENRDFISQHSTNVTQGLFGLHASMSLSEQTLVDVKKHLGQDPIHIHIAESQLDQSDCESKYQSRVVERLHNHGLLNRDSLLVHAIHVDDHELDIIKQQDCTIAVNVASNMNNSVGIPDILKFISKGIPVIIGNDGMSWSMASEYLTLYYAMHHRYQTPTAFNLGHLLTMINNTYAYASRCFGVKLGRLTTGYQADFMTVHYDAPTPINADNAFGHLFFGLFPAFKPTDVYVSGQRLVKNGELTSRKLHHSLQGVPAVAMRIWREVQTKE